jgi:hypothetical protein
MVHNNDRRASKKHKRGVILLVVVSLLTLMVLIGVTYVLFANRSLQNARESQRRDEYREPPERLFGQVVGQLLFDTVSRSALRGHSLLQDLYGPDFITGTVANLTPTGVNPNNDNGDQWPSDNNPAAAPRGQAFAFQCTFTPANQQMPWLDYYTGRVLTFTTGPAAGYSTRVLQYDPTVTPARLHVEAIETAQTFSLVPNVGDTFIINGAPFNGAGAGFDDTNSPPSSVLNISAVYAHQSAQNLPAFPSSDLVALLPHLNGYDTQFGRVYFNASSIAPPPNPVPITSGLARGGFDEPWDAADYQNMFLAMVPPVAAVQNSDTDPTNNVPILPSFHRPELVNYWINYMITGIFVPAGVTNAAEQFEVMAQPYGADQFRNTADDDVPVPRSTLSIEQRDRIYNITRCSVFRPMPWDHPNFTGSNAALAGAFNNPVPSNPAARILNAQALFAVLTGRNLAGVVNQNLYDVDSDNDGVPDSVWIDAGFPVATTPDGKRYKPLFAFLVVDLDGRIDMNAHGNLAHVARQEVPPASGQYDLFHRPQYPVPGTSGVNFGLALGPPGNVNPIFLPRGVGFGPAEVDFLNLLHSPPTTTFAVNPANAATMNAVASYENILRGRYASNMPGDAGATAFPGAPTLFDPLNQVKHHGVPNDYSTWGAWFASPPDVWGRGAVVLDWGGQPVYAPFASVIPPAIGTAGSPGEMLDNPYELVLGGQLTNTDSPYTLVELEKILRYHDYDTQKLVSRPLLPEANGGAGSVLATNPPGIIGLDHVTRQRLSGRGAYLPASSGIPPGTQLMPPTGQFPNTSWRAMGALFGKLPGNMTVLDMYAAKINFALQAGGIPSTPALVNSILHQLAPWELRHGGKFDLNRWLGNGFDSTLGPLQDGVADDPVEAFADPTNPAPFAVPPYNGPREPGWLAPAAFANWFAEHANAMDVNNDGVAPPPFPGGSPAQRSLDRMLARQLYARHLYCLATLFIDPTFDPPMPHEPTLNQTERREMFLRRIAQWAVNVVDYRDSDAIMTPFEYDVNPWNGWDVDSNPATDGSTTLPELYAQVPGGPLQPRVWGAQGNERRLVWGCEQPDLLITETLAFHSRNVKDTDVAGMMDMKRSDPNTTDTTLDQFRVPQGSVFLEFYCPRPYRWQNPSPQFNQPPNQKPRLPRELYDANGFLQLARLAPVRPGETLGRPVWRVAMAPMLNEEDGADPFKPVHPQTMAGARSDRGQQHRESGSFDWQDTSLLTYPDGPTPPAPVAPLAQFRYAYFSELEPTAAEFAQSYRNRVPNSFPLLAPGGYAVLGPRPMTHLGSYTPSAPPLLWDTMAGNFNGYSNQRIELNPTAAPNVCAVYDTNDTATTRTPGAGNIRDVVTIVADNRQIPFSSGANWTTLQWTSGLNITEPLLNAPGTNYYPEPADPTSLTTPNLPPDAGFYDDPDPAISSATALFPGTPVEGDDAGNAGRPIYENSMQNTGTYEDVSSIYLQRLANPNLPWNPLPTDPVFGAAYNGNLLINPYITVDWASLDVTVFAGDENTDQDGSDMMPLDPDDPDPNNTAPEMVFRSRQRAFLQGYGPYAAGSQSIWSPITENMADGGPYAATGPNAGAPNNPYFNYDLSNDLDNVYTPADRHTLGYLSAQLGYPSPPQGPAPVPPPPFVRPYLGEPAVDNAAGQPEPAPFPWLTFANRPFANPYEIMMVPASAPSRLAIEVTPGHLSLDNMVPPPTAWGSNPNPYDVTNPQALRMPFGHLLNFFHSEDTGPKPAMSSGPPLPPQPPALSPHFQRMFDYIEVPSPYAGSERWFNPATGHFDNAGLYRPPFNKLSRFRDAGRININTVFDDQVLISAIGHFPGLDATGPGSFSDKVFRSRQGYGYGAPGSLFTMDPTFPTFFGNPFRPLDAADLMPDIPASPLSMRRNGLFVAPGQQRSMPVEATFFRSDPDPVAPTVRNRLFDQIADATTFGTNVNQYIYRNTERNPYFRYQVMQKLGNTFSTNSNVFAVWITVGFFEVEDNRYTTGGPIVLDAGHPDGLRLGQEIGADSGEIIRHRAFYIIDRSVPVGHVPGQKLNSENCILLRRVIE